MEILIFAWTVCQHCLFNVITVSDLSVAAVITNLDASVTVLENQPLGTFVYHVSQSDVNVGDTPTFSASFATPACTAMYEIDAACT